MFRHELSSFLRCVLDAMDRLPDGVMVDEQFEPDASQVRQIAENLGAQPDEVRSAILGLEALSCLVQQTLEFPGIEAVHLWKVHPQCQARKRQQRAKHVRPARRDC